MRILCIGYISGDDDVIVDHKNKTIEKAYPLSDYDIEVRLLSTNTLQMYIEDLVHIGGYKLLDNSTPILCVE